MKAIDANTVSAHGQMANSNRVSFFGNKTAKTRILVLGNSITRHGPKPEIGWNADWGMAASSPDKDYVHQLFSLFEQNRKDVCMHVRQCATWELDIPNNNIEELYQDEKAFKPNIIIFRLGENVQGENKKYFKESLVKFIDYLATPTTKVVFATCFWRNGGVDDDIIAVAKDRGYNLVDLGYLGDDTKMKAIGCFAHTGVANHPNDLGMKNIATLLYNSVIKL